MTGFVYRWRNKVNNKYYIGSHRGTPDDGYLASGVAINAAFKKYGIENFQREILYTGPDYAKEETRLIEAFNACDDKMSYNIMHMHENGNIVSDEARLKKSLALKNRVFTESHRQKISDALTGSVMPEDQKQKIKDSMIGKHAGKANPFYGKTHSEETLSKISAALKGKKHSETTRQKIKEATKNAIQPKTTCMHCGMTSTMGNIKRWHNDNCKSKAA